MVAATLLVQVFLLPVLVATGAVLIRGARRLAESADRLLAALLTGFGAPAVPQRQPVGVRVRSGHIDLVRSRANPHRGPPSGCC